LVALTTVMGCGGTGEIGKKKDDFFTSGSREADQRASQRMAKAEQLTGSGEGAGEKAQSGKQAASTGAPDGSKKDARVVGKLTLFDRLGGEAGISNLVVDFTARALQDPRVNWQRKGVQRGGFSIQRGRSVTWSATEENVANLNKHLVQFLTLATGGRPEYQGNDMKATHAHMHIGNPEFDAALGDLKASLDKMQTPNKEQKELLAIVESTRPQIVTER
jgi:hemoglobin